MLKPFTLSALVLVLVITGVPTTVHAQELPPELVSVADSVLAPFEGDRVDLFLRPITEVAGGAGVFFEPAPALRPATLQALRREYGLGVAPPRSGCPPCVKEGSIATVWFSGVVGHDGGAAVDVVLMVRENPDAPVVLSGRRFLLAAENGRWRIREIWSLFGS